MALLALIILQRGRAIERDALAFTLFPESNEATALAELRRYLSLTNKALAGIAGSPWIRIEGDTVRWNAQDGAFVDAVEFERLAQDPATYEQSIDLYTGDLLEGIYDDWVLPERERLRSRYVFVLNEALNRCRSERVHGKALLYANRLLALDPWREDIVRSLVAIRYESGDAAGALAEYEDFAKRLRDELSAGPMPETVALRAAIVRNEALPGSFDLSPKEPAQAKTTGAALLPFVGRARELDALKALWKRSARGAGTFALVVGEAGAGKSRLLSELARIVALEGGRVFVGTTAALETRPYQAIVEALRSGLPLLAMRPPLPGRRATLARLLPELGDPDRAELALPDASPERETAKVYDALASAVRTLATPRPLLLVLEDLQWAGASTIEALKAIVPELSRVPVLVVGTARQEEAPAGHPLRALQRSLRGTLDELTLERLEQHDVEQLVERLEGLQRGGSALARQLYEQSEGNALFLNEAISSLLERGELLGTRPVESINRLISHRISRLGEHARTVAEIAALAGPGCNVDLVRDVSNLSAASVAMGFDELLESRLLREAGARSSYDYVFTHHLVADAVYGDVKASLRAQRHLRIANLLRAAYDETALSPPAREIARHFELGGDLESAAQWLCASAAQASSLHAYGDAIDVATRALELSPKPEARRRLLEIRERARSRRGEREGQRADIDALGELAGDDPAGRFEVIRRRVLLARALGDSDDEDRLIEELAAIAETLGGTARAHALLERATRAGLRSRQSEGLGPAREALALFESTGDIRGQLECYSLLVDFMANTGDVAGSRSCLALMHERASSLADQAVESRALVVAATAALLRQEYRECFDLTVRALAIQTRTGDREAEASSRGRLAVTAAWLADFSRSLSEFEAALEVYEAISHKRGLAITYTNRTFLLMRLGLFDEALLSIDRSNELFKVVHEQRTVVTNQVNASFVRAQLGEAADAKRLALDAFSLAREIGFPAFEAAALANLGNAERLLGEFEPAIAHMRAGLELRRPIQEARDFADDLADLTLAYAAAGRSEDARRTALELLEAGGGSFEGALWPQYAWWAVSRGLAAGGMADEAREAAARARAELDAFKARIEDARARAAFSAIPINLVIAEAATG